MKTFEIGVFEEQGGYLSVKAEDKKQAERMAQRFIDDYGFELSDWIRLCTKCHIAYDKGNINL